MKNKNLLIIYLTVLIDFIGVGLVIPIFAPLFLGTESTLFVTDTPENIRNILLGLTLAVFPLFQIFGAPILGALSDKYGRKKILFISIFGTAIGYLLMVLGINSQIFYLILLSRIIDGFTGGNISVATSAISDISTPEEKVRNFGILGALFGICFIVGPYIGGKLSDSSFYSGFNYSTPFVVAGVLSLVNLVSVGLFFKETLSQKIERTVSLTSGIRNLKKAFTDEKFKTVFEVIFLLTLGFAFFTTFFQPYLISKFQFKESQIGELFAYTGFWIAFTQGFLLKYISKYLDPKKSIYYGSIGLGISLLCLLVPGDVSAIYFLTPFIAISNGILSPNYQSIISKLADQNSQGEIFGINQSITSLGIALAPILASLLVNFDDRMPILFGGLITLFAATIFKKRFLS